MSEYELPESRLATTDESGKRVYVHPHDLKGKWKNRRLVFSWILLAIYLVMPWIYLNGEQIIRLDLPAREFHIFGSTFYGHDGPFLIYLLLSFVFFISFITTLFGRVWCGYACPQTVFIDLIYRFIERKVEGSGAKRDKLEKSAWTKEKVLKRFVKWTLYIIVSLHIVHSGIGYFVGTHELLFISLQSPSSHPTLFITMLTLTLIILVDFGWFREQFCIIACPYGRFQSIVMDENSLIVAYDTKRGEPRKRSAESKITNSEGDCVNCNRCVNVCPTGIDIRDGLQMECIACTMCIDACDDIMRRVDKPEGLIKYTTENKLDSKKNKISARVYIYFLLFVLTFTAMSFSLVDRSKLKAQVIRSGNSAFQYLKNEKKVVNHFKLKISYMNDSLLALKLMTNNKSLEIVSFEDDLELQSENYTYDFFVKFPMSLLIDGKNNLKLNLVNIETNEIVLSKDVEVVGPITEPL